jgi:hypothetical protein
MKQATALAIAVLFALMAIPAFSQNAAVNATIPFAFGVGEKELPPGEYQFRLDPNNRIAVQNLKTRETISVPVITRLAADSTAKHTRVTFDVTAGKKYLEALWPAEGDAFLVRATKGKHQHDTVMPE